DGGAAVDPNGMLGTLEEGKYADLLVVDGDPLADITVLQDHDRITAVMKDGVVYRGLMNGTPYVAQPDEVATTLGRPATGQQREAFLESAG
ncbi:MAG: amidohydrolase family protein, partial [Gammaproteobacteria bacterium]|nr:amidohydrolase family protein [Gammaproteobacteria bacterium]